MRITEVTVDVQDCQESADFYEKLLGLPVTRETDSVTVQVGRSSLTLRQNPAAEGCHHFAVTIPSNKFDQAKRWVAERAEIMTKGADDEFEYDAGWNARSFYFPGPERSILEFIIRRDLDNAAEGDFGPEDFECISEVGVAVPDVLATVAALAAEAGIEPYGVVPRDRFAPVGTIDGLVILVSPDRTWFPADDWLSKESRIVIDAIGDRPGSYALGAESTLTVRAE